MIIPIVRGGRVLKNVDKYHNFFTIVRKGGKGSKSYDRNYHRGKCLKSWTANQIVLFWPLKEPRTTVLGFKVARFVQLFALSCLYHGLRKFWAGWILVSSHRQTQALNATNCLENLYPLENPNLTREMVDPAIYTNNDMIIVPARCQAILPPSQKLYSC